MQVANAFTAKNWTMVTALTVNGPVPVFDNNTTQPLGTMTRDQFYLSMRDCVITRVFEKGVNNQRSDGIEWVCPKQPVGRDKCNVRAYGVDFESAGKTHIIRAFRFDEYNSIDCPKRSLAPRSPGSGKAN